jgi:hypothetical protein
VKKAIFVGNDGNFCRISSNICSDECPPCWVLTQGGSYDIMIITEGYGYALLIPSSEYPRIYKSINKG